MKRELIAGVDVGGTYIRMCVASRDFKVLEDKIVQTSTLSNGARTPELLLDAITAFIADRLHAVAALCMGFPSVVSKDKRCIIQTPNVQGLDMIDMAGLAEKRFPFPVYIEKDVNLLLRNDMETLNLETSQTVLGFYIGTGLGNALWINGAPYSGASGAAGELGHIPLWGNKLQCGCGNIGCAETLASGKRLDSIVSERYQGVEIRDFFSVCSSDPFVGDYLELLSIPIAAEMNILDPAAVVFGGGVFHMKGFPQKKLVEAVRGKLRSPFPKESVKILCSSENHGAGMKGAVRYALDKLGNG